MRACRGGGIWKNSCCRVECDWKLWQYPGPLFRTRRFNGSTRKETTSEIVFIGSGSSVGTPNIFHLMYDPKPNQNLDGSWDVSKLAHIGDPKYNKNYRCNPSIVIKYFSGGLTTESVSSYKNILIDAGKTFREAAVRWFPVHDIKSIDSVLLTHGHADSIFGIDDLRSTQKPTSKRPLDVYQSVDTRVVTQMVYRYLYPELTTNLLTPKELEEIQSRQAEIIEDSTNPTAMKFVKKRFTANINWIDMFPYHSFPVCGLTFTPFPVMHGEDMTCMGFLFGSNQKVCYISDISRMLPRSLDIILKSGEIHLFIVDAVRPGRIDFGRTPFPTHICIEEALDLVRIIKPRKTLLIGMGSSIEHESTNLYLKSLKDSESIDVELAFDGLSVPINL